jgi:ribonuclease P protein component
LVQLGFMQGVFALHETHVPAKAYPAKARARLFETDGYQRRAPGPQDEEASRAQEIDRRLGIPVAVARSAHFPMQRQHRLRKSAEFQRVRALKQSWAHPLLVLYVAPNNLDVTRVGISVTKRLGKAVERNRVKRLIREAIRSLLPVTAPGRDLVFVARGAAAEARYVQVRDAVERLVGRARLISRSRIVPREGGQSVDEVDSIIPD